MRSFFITLFSLLFVFSPQAYAKNSQKFVCSIWHGRALYHELKASDLRDKTMHCTLSCALALRCPNIEVWNLGVLKELFDLLGFGDAEWADLEANYYGIRLSYSRSIRDRFDCLDACSARYE
jgi:hypothetical protein